MEGRGYVAETRVGCKGRTGKEERVIKEDTEGRQRSKTVKAETLTESN